MGSDIRHVRGEAQKELVKKFEVFTSKGRSRWQVWSDWITISAIAVSNATDKSHFDEREQQYMTIVKKYTKQEVDAFADMFSILVMALEDNSEQDFLGELYMCLGLGSDHAGQFFTPYHLCEFMSAVTTPAEEFQQKIGDRGWVAVCDPTCGAGALLVAFANECRKKGINYQTDVLFVAQDIDYIVGMMCYLQMSLLGMPGYVVIGDTLATKNELADYAWNPVTGCLKDCRYCYARKSAIRFASDWRRNLAERPKIQQVGEKLFELDTPWETKSKRFLNSPTGFLPTMHKYRFDWPQKVKVGSSIMVCTDGDLFGPWVPEDWILRVFAAADEAPQHQYIFLTQYPERYKQLANHEKLPRNKNFWYGSTATVRESGVWTNEHYNAFVAIEPLLGPFEGDVTKAFRSGTAPVVWTSSSACVGIIPISASAASQSSTYSPASTAISVVWCSMQILAGCGCMVWGTPKRMQ